MQQRVTTARHVDAAYAPPRIAVRPRTNARAAMRAAVELLSDDVATDAAVLARLLTREQRLWRPHALRPSIARHASVATRVGERWLRWLEQATDPSRTDGLPAQVAAGEAEAPEHGAAAWRVRGLLAWTQLCAACLVRSHPDALERLAAQQARVQAVLARLPDVPHGGRLLGGRVDPLACLSGIVRHQHARLERALDLTEHAGFPGEPLVASLGDMPD